MPPRSAPRWLTLVSTGLALLLALVALRQGVQLDWPRILAEFPATPLFWLAFAGFFMAVPLGDWLAFRQLGMKPGLAGLAALLRKQVCNEVVLGYLGEAWFYTWARRQGWPDALGAIKDVAILSAMAGNLTTLVLLALAWRPLTSLPAAQGLAAQLWGSLALVVVILLLVVLARGRVFSLRPDQRRAILLIHLARIGVRLGLGALAWHLLLPEVGMGWWLMLSALRQLTSRLPLVSNRELLFAAITMALFGHRPEIVAAVAWSAGLFLAANVVAGLALVVLAVVRAGRAGEAGAGPVTGVSRKPPSGAGHGHPPAGLV